MSTSLPLQGHTILLVEDERALQRALAEALTDAGFTVLAERDGEWALRTFSQRPVDLVVLDALVPGRGGADVAQEIRRSPRGQATPIILASALLRTPEKKQRFEAQLPPGGPLHWLDKPFEPSQLVALCQKLLGLTKEETDPAERRRRREQAQREARSSGIPERLSTAHDQQEARSVESESQVRFRGAALVRGNLADTPFAEVLSQLHRWRATGALLLRHEPLKKIVYVREGVPLFVRSNLLGECLGQVLVRERMITLAECEESLRRLQVEKRHQGTVLIEMGCISPANLAYALQLQQETKLYDLFSWREGDYSFSPRAEAPPSLVALDGTAARLCFEGIERAYDGERAARALGEIDGLAVAVSDDPLDRFQEMGLEAEHARFYSLLDGRRTVRELLGQGCALSRDDAYKLLYALRCANMIRFVSPTRPEVPGRVRSNPGAGARRAGIAELPTHLQVPPPPVGELPERALPEPELLLRQQVERLAARAQDLRRGTLYEVLEVAPAALEQELRQAYAAKAREHHPDRLGPDTSAEARSLAQEIFDQIVRAFEVLSDSAQRAAYDAQLGTGEIKSDSDDVARILAAEASFRSGEELLKKQELRGAAAAFAESVRLYPDEAEFHACLGWATWLASSRDEAGEATAQSHLSHALHLNARMDRAYVFRGSIFRARGREKAAAAEFEKALTCNPACAEALRELKLGRR